MVEAMIKAIYEDLMSGTCFTIFDLCKNVDDPGRYYCTRC